MFILPPHPNSSMKIQRSDLSTYENMNLWTCQRKFNGTHVVIWIHNDQLEIWERRGKPLSTYKLTESMKQCLLSLNLKNKETVLVGEVLHTKAVSKITDEQAATNTIVLFDVLFHEKQLSELTQMERLTLLEEMCRKPTEKEIPKFRGAVPRALIVKEEGISKLWLAEHWDDEFSYHFDECCDQMDKNGKDLYPEIEGLVLRLKTSRIQFRGNDVGDVNWIVRCRKLKLKMYTF